MNPENFFKKTGEVAKNVAKKTITTAAFTTLPFTGANAQTPPKIIKEVTPIIVTDPNDPRLKAYQDSLQSFINFNKFIQETKIAFKNAKSREEYLELDNKLREKYPFNPNIAVEFNKRETIDSKNFKNSVNDSIIQTHYFKNPVQPVFLASTPEADEFLKNKDGDFEKTEKDFTPRHLNIKTNKNSNLEKFHEAGYPNKDISLYLKEVMTDGQQIWDSIDRSKGIPPTIFHSPKNSNEMLRPHEGYPNLDILYVKENGNWKPKFIQNKVGEKLPYGDNSKITKDFQYPDTKQE